MDLAIDVMTAPPKLHGVVARPRAFEWLDHMAPYTGVWIAGGPGEGKSCLLAKWLDATSARAVWLRLSDVHDDAAILFLSLDAALAALYHKGGGGEVQVPTYAAEWRASLDVFVPRWCNAWRTRLPSGAWLVLDNLDAMDRPEAEAVLARCCAGLGGHLNIAVTARELPTGEWLQQVVERRLVVFPPALLRFDLCEVENMLRLAGREVQAQALLEKTDGWAAGITLAAALLPALSGAPRHLDESLRAYFRRAVFGLFSGQERVLLTAVCHLPWIDARLLDALALPASAIDTFDSLAKRRLFVTHHAGERAAFVLHSLLKESLLDAMPANERSEFLHTSVDVLVEQGHFAEAVELARRDHDRRWLAAWVDRYAAVFRRKGRHELLVDVVRELLGEGVPLRSETMTEAAQAAFAGNDPLADLWLAQAFDQASALDDAEAQRFCAAVALVELETGVGSFSTWELWFGRFCVALERAARPVAVDRDVLVAAAVLFSAGHQSETVMPLSVELIATTLQACFASIDRSVPADDRMTLAAAWLFYELDVDAGGEIVEPIIGTVRRSPAWRDASPIGRCEWLHAECNYYFKSGRYGSLADTLVEAERDIAQRVQGDSHLTQAYWLTQLALVQNEVHAARDHAQRALDLTAGRNTRNTPWVIKLLARCHLSLGRWDEAAGASERAVASARALGFPEVWVVAFAGDRFLAELGAGHTASAIEVALKLANDAAQTKHALWCAHARIAQFFDTLESRSARDDALREAVSEYRRSDCPIFLAPLLQHAARVCLRALELDVEPDFIRAVIRQRKLDAPKGAGPAWPWPIRIKVIGSLGLTKDDRAIRFHGKQPKKPLELLRLLALAHPLPLTAATLASTLWPGEDGARKSLEMAITRLRAILEDDTAVEVSGGCVGLSAKRVFVDLAYASHALLELETAMIRGGGAPQEAEAVLRLTQGTVLPGEEDFDDVLSARKSHQRSWIRCACLCAASYRSAGQNESAISFLERAVAEYPAVEFLHAELIKTYRAVGMQSEALAALRHCQAMLHRLAGAVPSPETVRLALQSEPGA